MTTRGPVDDAFHSTDRDARVTNDAWIVSPARIGDGPGCAFSFAELARLLAEEQSRWTTFNARLEALELGRK